MFDENLPRKLTFVPSRATSHATDFGAHPSDDELWEHARVRHLTIITKDSDFAKRVQFSDPPPWVVLLAFGNLRRREYHLLLARAWLQVELLLKTHKLVTVHANGLVSAM